VDEYEGQRFYAPQSLAEFTRLRAANPHAILLAGGPDVGVWVTKQFRALGDIVCIGQVAELKEIRAEAGVLRIGAGVSLTDSYAALVKHYPQLTDMWERFASVPIRNAGTLGGNVAHGSPVGDAMPGLIALGACVVPRNSERACCPSASRGGARLQRHEPGAKEGHPTRTPSCALRRLASRRCCYRSRCSSRSGMPWRAWRITASIHRSTRLPRPRRS
jgi:hypothetical protein